MNKVSSIFLAVLVSFGILLLPSSVLAFTQSSANHHKIYILAGQSNAASNGSFGTYDDYDVIDGQSYANVFDFNAQNDSYGALSPLSTLSAQNNVKYFGPEKYLMRTIMKNSLSSDNNVLIKVSFGATNLDQQWNSQIANGLFDFMINRINSVIQALPPNSTYELVNFYWVQGESDSFNTNYSNNYQTNLTNFINDLRTRLSSPDLGFTISDLRNGGNYKDIIVNSQNNVANNLSFVNILNNSSLKNVDQVHYDTPSIKLLGQNLAYTTMPDLSIRAKFINYQQNIKQSKYEFNVYNASTQSSGSGLEIEIPISGSFQVNFESGTDWICQNSVQIYNNQIGVRCTYNNSIGFKQNSSNITLNLINNTNNPQLIEFNTLSKTNNDINLNNNLIKIRIP